jgi:hypothetical protein
MNGSNATYNYNISNNACYISWPAPSYPNVYNGNGKQYILVNNNVTAPTNSINLNYGTSNDPSGFSGPGAINGSDMQKLGTSTGVLNNNSGVDYNYGSYFTWILPDLTLEQAQAYMANVSITILDP